VAAAPTKQKVFNVNQSPVTAKQVNSTKDPKARVDLNEDNTNAEDSHQATPELGGNNGEEQHLFL
jgi:hypothetical protein